jgi:RimJ/RimL family protein N-acetyltransferase
MLEATDRQTFGLFDGDRLVGITGVITKREDPSGRTAMLVMSFIVPAYRGRGLSRLFYDARLEWIARHGTFDRVVVSHRRSNEASRRANQHFGFILKETASRTWPDGTVEDELSYELVL